MKEITLILTGVGLIGCGILIKKHAKDRRITEKREKMRKELEEHVDEISKPMDDAIKRVGEVSDEMYQDIENHKKWLDEHKGEA